MKICNKCSVANDDKAVFCVGCGAVLQNTTQENPVITEEPTPTQTESYSEPQAYAPPQSPFVQPVSSQPAMPQMPYGQPYGFVPIDENMLPPEYKPVTIGQYIGYSLLFSLPIIGIIMLFVTAFDSDKSISLRNYAKSILVWCAISIVLAILLFVFAGIVESMYGYAY